jgi:SOS response regulatory protein OraA/RecX
MDYATFRTRLGSFLQRRGFGYEVATRTVKTLWQQLKEEEEPFEEL